MSAKHVFKVSHRYDRDSLDALVAHLRNGTTSLASSIVVNTTEMYYSNEIAEQEFNRLFYSRPYFIGVSSELPENGSFFTVNNGVQEVIAVRDERGTFRVFANACSHRGAPLALKKSGKVSNNTFVCKFHGWAFSTSGALKSVAQSKKFGNVDSLCAGLVEFPAVEKSGMLWAHSGLDAPLALDGELGTELVGELVNLEFDQMQNTSSKEYEMNCNWKLGIDGFCESYHFTSLHKRTIGAVTYPHTTLFKTYNSAHFKTVVTNKDIDNLDLGSTENHSINDGAMTIYVLFPNTVLIVIAGGCLTATVVPSRDSPRKHVLRLATYVYNDVNEKDVEEIARRDRIASDNAELHVPEFSSIAEIFNLITIEEDYGLADRLQTQYETGVTSVLYGRNEPGLQVFHRTLRARLGLQPMEELDED